MTLRSAWAVTAVLWCGACDAGSPAAADPTAVDPTGSDVVAAAEIDLEGTGALIRDDEVKDAKSLEASINADPDNRVDVDKDGKQDKLQVVEERQPRGRRFRVRALPSSKPSSKPDAVAVAVAEIDVVPEDDHASSRCATHTRASTSSSSRRRSSSTPSATGCSWSIGRSTSARPTSSCTRPTRSIASTRSTSTRSGERSD